MGNRERSNVLTGSCSSSLLPPSLRPPSSASPSHPCGRGAPMLLCSPCVFPLCLTGAMHKQSCNVSPSSFLTATHLHHLLHPGAMPPYFCWPAEPGGWGDHQEGPDAFPTGGEAQASAGAAEPWCGWAAPGFKAMGVFLGLITSFWAHVLLQGKKYIKYQSPSTWSLLEKRCLKVVVSRHVGL